MKRGALVTTIFAIFVACAAGYAAISLETQLRDDLARSIRRATGNEPLIAGGASLSLYPSLAVTFRQISLAGPPGGKSNEPIVSVESVKIEAEFLPLFRRHIKISQIVLERPRLNLALDAQGRPNWSKPRTPSPPPGPAHKAVPNSPGDASHSTGLASPTYPATPETQNSDNDDLGRRNGTTNIAQRVSLSNRSDLNGAELHIEGGEISLHDQYRKRVFHLSGVSMSLHPDVASNSLEATGVISASGETLRYKTRLGLSWEESTIRVPLLVEVASALTTVKFDGRIRAKEESGNVYVDCTGSVNAVATGFGSIAGDLDIGGRTTEGGVLNTTLRPSLLTYGNVTAHGGVVSLGAENGAFTALFDGINLYGGSAKGNLKIEARQGAPAVSGSAVIENVAALPFLTSLSRFDWLSGDGGVSVSFTGTGYSVAQVTRSLSGEARLSLSNGAVEGLDLPQMLRSAQEGVFRWARNPSDKTPFERFTASFAIASGAARTTDLFLTGPNIQIIGDGSVDLPREMLDLRLKPTITAGAPDALVNPGRGADSVELPLVVRGPWSKPRIEPDLNRVLADPSRAAASAKTLVKPIEKLTGGALKSEDVGKAIDMLFGKKKKPPSQTPDQPQ